MPKVSIIVPIYNTEQFLSRCLDSLINQTLSDIEIICINDCSLDNSLDILKEYASKDERIKIIDLKENQGAAIARNKGLEVAKGEYLGFVDSDDYVDLDFYEKLYKKAIETNSQIARGNILEVINGEKKYVYEFLHNKIESSKLNFNGLFVSAIYDLDLIKSNKIFFIENCSYGEDRLFPLKASLLSNNLCQIKDTYYNYIRRKNSASLQETFSKKQIEDYIFSTNLLFDFVEKNSFNASDLNEVLDSFIMQTIDIIYKNSNEDILYNLLKNLYKKKMLVDDIFKKSNNLFINSIKNKNIEQIRTIFENNYRKIKIAKELREKLRDKK